MKSWDTTINFNVIEVQLLIGFVPAKPKSDMFLVTT